MRFVLGAVASIAALAVAAPVLAQTDDTRSNDGLYGNLGWAGTNAQDAMTQGITGRVGGRFHNYLGVEGEITGGLGSDHRVFAPGTSSQTNVDVKQELAGAGYVVGFLPVTPNLDLIGRVGYGASRYDINPANGFPGYTATEHGVRYGVGAQYFLDGVNGVRFDYTRQHMGSRDDPGGYFSDGRDAGVWAVTFARKF